MTAIPRVLHQLYFPDLDAAPPSYRQFSESAGRIHPAWDHRLWTESEARAFLRQHYPRFVPVFDGYRYRIQRCDAIRFFLLDHFGGVYADMDIEFLRPMDRLISGPELVLSHRTGLIGNAIMASVPSHPLWPSIIEELPRRTARRPFDLRQPLMRSIVYHVSYSTGSELVDDLVRGGGFDRLDSTMITSGDVLEADPHLPVDNEVSFAIHHKGMRGLPAHRRALSNACCYAAQTYQFVSRVGRSTGDQTR